jgi:hypothetical protein
MAMHGKYFKTFLFGNVFTVIGIDENYYGDNYSEQQHWIK